MSLLKKTDQFGGHICTEHLTTVTTLSMLEVREMRHGYLERINIKNDSFLFLFRKSSSLKTFATTPSRARELDRKDEVKAEFISARLRLNIV